MSLAFDLLSTLKPVHSSGLYTLRVWSEVIFLNIKGIKHLATLPLDESYLLAVQVKFQACEQDWG